MNSMTVTGGARLGDSYWDGINYSWPLVTLTILENEITLSMPFKHLTLSRNEITEISPYRGIISDGLLIQHSSKAAPRFLVFWTNPEKAADTLKALDYPYSNAVSKASPVLGQRKIGLLWPMIFLICVFFVILVHERLLQRGWPDALLSATGLTMFLAFALFILKKRIFR